MPLPAICPCCGFGYTAGMNEMPKAHRLRRFQYSLRTLLLVMLLVSIGMSWFAIKMQKARKQKAAVEAIKKLGGEVTYDWTFDKSQSGPPGPAWMRGLLGADFFGRVVIVSLDFTQVTDIGLEPLEELGQLKGLFLSGTHVTDAGLKHISKLNQLQTLSLIGTQVTDGGLEQLKGLNQLRRMSLDVTQVTDVGLEHLKGLNQLHILGLGNTQVTDDGIKRLQQALPNCEIDH